MVSFIIQMVLMPLSKVIAQKLALRNFERVLNKRMKREIEI